MKKVVRTRPEVGTDLVDGFRDLLRIYSPSCVVADSMERSGVMQSAIKPVSAGRMAGPATTVRLYPGDLVDALAVLELARPGDVIVVDAAGETETSVWGGLMAGLCKARGVVGAVVDGAVRDVDEVRDLGFPLYSRAVVPRSTHSPYSNRMEPIEINVPVTAGRVLVHPGDVVLADEIGVVVVPLSEAAAVLQRAREQAAKEEATRKRIQEGRSVEELLKEFGRL